MAKNSITDYSTTAASNTDIQSVDIDEACAPSGINNAIRELMVDLARVNAGTDALDNLALGANGYDVTPGSDIDADLITVNVTGTPKVFWDESADAFSLNKGAILTAGDLTVSGGDLSVSGEIISGSNILSDTDSTDSLGSTGVRWLKGWFDTLTAGTLTSGSGSITDSSGAISFGNENLTTTGTLAAGATTLTGKLAMGGNDIIGQAGAVGSLVITGGTAVNLGTNINLYDSASASSGDFLIKANATNSLFYDSSSILWNFFANKISTTGTLASGAATITGGATVSTGDLTVSGGFLNLGSGPELTIAAGVVTATNSYHKIDTESDASSDDLDTINGGTEGDILLLRTTAGPRDVVIKHNTGNIILMGGAPVTLTATNDSIMLLYNGLTWNEVLNYT